MVLCNFVGYSLTIISAIYAPLAQFNWSIEALVSDIQLALRSFKKCQARHLN